MGTSHLEYQTITYNSLEVCYTPEIDGGGSNKKDYVEYLQSTFNKVDRVFEWCAGPGFIGFWLLASNFCESLCLADVNPEAVEACRETVRRNGLADRVCVHLSDCLDGIPDSESWDLVCGNPPHSGTDSIFPGWGRTQIYMDQAWSLHRRFYRDVGRFLNTGGNVVILENRDLSDQETFRPMIEENGLGIVGTSSSQQDPRMYYIWSAKRGDD